MRRFLINRSLPLTSLPGVDGGGITNIVMSQRRMNKGLIYLYVLRLASL